MQHAEPSWGQSRRPTRIHRAFVLVIALALALGGCWFGSHTSDQPPKAGDQQQMDRIAAEIQAALAQHPDVATAEVKYANNLTSSGTAYVNITVKAGAAFGPVEDEAIKLLWQSKLKPLHSISIGVIDAADRLRGDNRYIDPDGKDLAQLEAKYGQRPR